MTFILYLKHHRIVNTKNGSHIGLRLRQFSVGKLDASNSCESAWLELHEENENSSMNKSTGMN